MHFETVNHTLHFLCTSTMKKVEINLHLKFFFLKDCISLINREKISIGNMIPNKLLILQGFVSFNKDQLRSVFILLLILKCS